MRNENVYYNNYFYFYYFEQFIKYYFKNNPINYNYFLLKIKMSFKIFLLTITFIILTKSNIIIRSPKELIDKFGSKNKINNLKLNRWYN